MHAHYGASITYESSNTLIAAARNKQTRPIGSPHAAGVMWVAYINI